MESPVVSTYPIIAIGGFSSEVGKTTLLCELLRAFPGWEAIKLTRGHYRSCGKDPHACCVSHLLGDEPVVYAGRERTYVPGKDTGRYWDAGASDVQWVIATDDQVERGIKQALARVRAPGVLIEGNSFLKYVDAEFTVIAARTDSNKIKPTARQALKKAHALYLFDSEDKIINGRRSFSSNSLIGDLPIYTPTELPQLIAQMRKACRV